MPTAKLVITDQVNVKFKGLDPEALDRCQEVLAFYVPGFVHMPSYKIGHWDGKIRLFQRSGSTFLNLAYEAIDVLSKEFGYTIDIEDQTNWKNTISPQLELVDNTFLREYNDDDGNPITLWDHQVVAINIAITQGGGILELATGSGKTLICGCLAKIWQPHGRVVVIVPSIDLIVQTQFEFQKIGLDTGIWFGERKERKQTTIATWQSLDHVPELFNEVECVIVDEVHQAKAKVLSEMLAGPGANVPFRFGCTGTMPKEDLFRKQILGTVGETVFVMRSYELQEKGILAHADIYQVKLYDSLNPVYERVRDHHEEWRHELTWLFSDKQRVAYMGELIREVAENNGNTLVLVQYRKHGKILEEYIPNSLSLDGRDKDRTKYYKAFNEGDNEILICTFGIASTGIDIPRIFNLVIIEPGKKFEKVIQTLGRGLRIAKDKTHLGVFDVCGDSGFSKNHAATRRALYKEAKQPLQVIEVEYYDANFNG